MLVWPVSRKMAMASLPAQAGHEAGAVAGADLGAVLVPVRVADPVQPVLDSPVAADEAGKVGGPGLDDGQRGDRVDRLGGPFLAVLPGQWPAAAHDLDGLGGVGEGQPGRDRGDFQGAPFSAAVAFVSRPAGDRDVPPAAGTVASATGSVTSAAAIVSLHEVPG